jgi:hypothetical protein
LTRSQANRIGDLVTPSSVRGGLTVFFFRLALRWALARASVDAREVAREEAWAKRAGDLRLRAMALRPVAWTAVLEPQTVDAGVPHPRPLDSDGPMGGVPRAAALVVEALAFRSELAAESCPPRLRAHCERLFGTMLVPGRDRFEVHRGSGRHIVVGVGAGGALRAVEVLDPAGGIRAEADILADVQACFENPREPKESVKRLDAPRVLALTTRPRAEAAAPWAAIAAASPEAATLLREALFALFLDPEAPPDVDLTGRLAQGGPAGERSFWHAMQLVVFRNGQAAVLGSFVAGVEGEGAMGIAPRLGLVRPAAREGQGKRARPQGAPPRLEWKVEERASAALSSVGHSAAPVNAGGFLAVSGFGTRAWREARVSPESAIVVALQLALDGFEPNLDELECMVSLGHVEHGIVTRLGTTTAQMRAFLRAARKKGDADLGPELSAALAAHRERVAEAKRRESPEVLLEFSFFALARLSGALRALLAMLARLVALLIAWRTPPGERADLSRPIVAIDSSVPHPPSVAAFGRFGALAPPRCIWIHHSLGEDGVSFVLQLGPEYVARAEELRDAIVRSLARVHAAAASATSSKEELTVEPSPPGPRLAYRRLLGLLGALHRDRQA